MVQTYKVQHTGKLITAEIEISKILVDSSGALPSIALLEVYNNRRDIREGDGVQDFKREIPVSEIPSRHLRLRADKAGGEPILLVENRLPASDPVLAKVLQGDVLAAFDKLLGWDPFVFTRKVQRAALITEMRYTSRSFLPETFSQTLNELSESVILNKMY